MTESIHSHTFDNGLVLVAEPIKSLESAAFTLLVPAGCCYDPAERSGLSSFTCEMALRCAGPRDSRKFVDDLDNLGVERSESVSTPHTSFSGATLSGNLLPALFDLCRCYTATTLAKGPDGTWPHAGPAGAAGDSRRSGTAGHAGVAAAAISRSMGAAESGRGGRDQGDNDRRDSRRFPAVIPTSRHDPGRRWPVRLARTEGLCRPIVRRLAGD